MWIYFNKKEEYKLTNFGGKNRINNYIGGSTTKQLIVINL